MSIMTANADPINPRDLWASWTDQRWTCSEDGGDEPRPEPLPYQPSREDDLESLGFKLGEVGSPCRPPEGSTASEVEAFTRGWKIGLADLDACESWHRAEEDRIERDVIESAQHDMIRMLTRLCGPNADDRDDRIPFGYE